MNYIFLADGFEEVEAFATIDVIRRSGIDITTVSIMGSKSVVGAHGISVNADALFEDIKFIDVDFLILPGGQPGTTNLSNYKPLAKELKEHFSKGGNVAAICAAPMIFGQLSIADGRNVTCYPGCESPLDKANVKECGVVVDGNIITGRGPAFAADFGLAIVASIKGNNVAEAVAKAMLFK